MSLVHNAPFEINQLLLELKSSGYVTQEQVATTLLKAKHAKKHNQFSVHPITLVSKAGLRIVNAPHQAIDEEWLTQWLAERLALAYFKINPLQIDVKTVTQVMSFAFAKRHGILAVAVDDQAITIATSSPRVTHWMSGIKQTTRKSIRLVMSSPNSIERYTKEFYKIQKSVFGATEVANEHSNINNLEQLVSVGVEAEELDANDQHIVKIVDWLLQYAFEQRASDIHIEPRREWGRLRFRIDGVLHTVYQFPPVITAAVLARMKILARMDVAEKRRPLDGRIKTQMPDSSEVELRISTLPTAFGEKLVARIFDPSILVKDFLSLGLSVNEEEQWRQLIGAPTGIVLLTGPTGSGKTTTLYTSLKQMATSEVNVCTIEDPIEMIEANFNQMQVQTDIGLSFAQGVRALLRQDPDIIMVGEIRDRETADMAIQAALTGHLVISSLHTNDAASAMTRLVELGVPNYLINATLIGVMAQRLVRVLCDHCKRETSLCDEKWLALTSGFKSKKPKKIYEAVGCDHCRQTGFKGRVGLYELLRVSDEIRDCIAKSNSYREIRHIAINEGMCLLRLSGARKVAKGITTIEEVLRVVPCSPVNH
ncbi:MAG: GspE/PulE family protein [Pseudomonadota bacterium]